MKQHLIKHIVLTLGVTAALSTLTVAQAHGDEGWRGRDGLREAYAQRAQHMRWLEHERRVGDKVGAHRARVALRHDAARIRHEWRERRFHEGRNGYREWHRPWYRHGW